jgi:ABC-type nitrate/sulfonate/bicarbonate transport system permease component
MADMASWWNRSERLRSVLMVLVAMLVIWEALCWALKSGPSSCPRPAWC